jgi:hypothetical protein
MHSYLHIYYTKYFFFMFNIYNNEDFEFLSSFY